MPITSELRERIVAEVAEGYSLSAVARRHKVKWETVDRWVRRWEEQGSVATKRSERRARLSPSDMETLRALLTADPTLSYSALVERLVEAGGTRVGKTCMIRAVKKLGLKRARLHVAAKPKPAPGPRRFKQPREEWKPRTGERGHYPSDLTDREWAVIEPLLPALKDGGRHYKWSRRELLDGILYVLRTGCQWRALPHDLPPWKTVYGTFRAWRNDGTWERLNDSLRRHLRLASQRNEDATVWIIDSQSVRTTEKGGSEDMTRANG